MKMLRYLRATIAMTLGIALLPTISRAQTTPPAPVEPAFPTTAAVVVGVTPAAVVFTTAAGILGSGLTLGTSLIGAGALDILLIAAAHEKFQQLEAYRIQKEQWKRDYEEWKEQNKNNPDFPEHANLIFGNDLAVENFYAFESTWGSVSDIGGWGVGDFAGFCDSNYIDFSFE